MKKKLACILSLSILLACSKKKDNFDASGTFEATETIVSAQANGSITSLSIEEGKTLNAGEQVGSIDSLDLFLKKRQLQAQIKALLSRKPDVYAQTAALQAQLKQAQLDQKRMRNLAADNAIPLKQLDDANARVDVIKKQIEAQQSSLNINTSSIKEDTAPINVQIEQLNNQLAKCKIINPITGTVLTKYTEANEMAIIGKPLYKIADVSTLILRAYITGDQLPKVKLNQSAKVYVDESEDKYRTYNGVIEWISDKAEFTPKTIQTKNERANLVYAVKIRVKNDGHLKIGEYGEIKL